MGPVLGNDHPSVIVTVEWSNGAFNSGRTGAKTPMPGPACATHPPSAMTQATLPAANPAPLRTGRIIAILGMLAAFAPMATDMYLPGFQQMAADLGVSDGAVEVTLSVFFLGLAVGQFLYGPLIDRFGRRVPLLLGVGLYVLATLACLWAPDIPTLAALRFVQALGGASGMIIGRAIIADLFDAREGARALSLVITVMTLAPVLAPALGGVVVAHAGWKAVFLVMLAFGLTCGALVWRFLPETLPAERRHAARPAEVARTWGQLLTQRSFVVPALVGGLAQGSMFAFITGSPFVFTGLHGVSPKHYGLLFGLIACSLIVAAQLNRAALRRMPPERLLTWALCGQVLAAAATVAMASAQALWMLVLPLWLAIGTLGFIGANAASVAMAASGRHAGSGSSMVGGLQLGCAFTVSLMVAALQNGSAYPMTGAILLCGLLANGLWHLARPRSLRH